MVLPAYIQARSGASGRMRGPTQVGGRRVLIAYIQTRDRPAGRLRWNQTWAVEGCCPPTSETAAPWVGCLGATAQVGGGWVLPAYMKPGAAQQVPRTQVGGRMVRVAYIRARAGRRHVGDRMVLPAYI